MDTFRILRDRFLLFTLHSIIAVLPAVAHYLELGEGERQALVRHMIAVLKLDGEAPVAGT